jgi:NAD(P)-dependent dehydrogenase (short-subunit alcohol dehydrogenase family)
MNLDGRNVVVTGGAGGIGRALALRCAAEGARVAVTDVRREPLEQVTLELGDGHLGAVADVTDERSLEDLLERVKSELGPVDVFFANAGVATGTDPIDTSDIVWDHAFAINIRAHILAARALLPEWLARGEGYFVSTASAAGLLTQIGSAPYAVTKHAAVAFAEWLSITYGDRGIRVSCLCPMGVRTGMLEGDEVAHRVVKLAADLVEPDDVAAVTIEAIAQERFLVLPHPEVLTFFQRKAMDYDRWLAGMRRLQETAQSAAVPERPTD